MNKRMWLLLFALLLSFSSVGWSFYQRVLAHHGAEMAQSAQRLLDSVSQEQRKQMLLPFDTPKRVAWHFIPKPDRKGLPLREMNAAQRAATHALLRSALSQVGYDQTTRIMELEELLAQLEGDRDRLRRNPLGYYVTLFGSPTSSERWGVSFEGHHLSFNFVIQGDRVVASSPQFMGANPAIVQQSQAGFEKGLQILKEEEQLGFELVQSLSDEQRQRAVLADQAPPDVRSAGEAQPPQTPAAGLAWTRLGAEQQELLRKLIGVYIGKMPAGVAARRFEAIDKAGWEGVHFAWAGATKPGIGHSYRIQGPTFLIELNNTQPDAAGNPANHVHCLWRDLRGDFGLPAQ